MYQKKLLSEKIAENIELLITNGMYAPGDRLPSEMDFSTELNVSRATLREAFKILESKKIIVVKRGIGTFISDEPGSLHGSNLENLITENDEYHSFLRVAEQVGIECFKIFSHFGYHDKQRLIAVFRDQFAYNILDCFMVISQFFIAISEIKKFEYLKEMIKYHRDILIEHQGRIVFDEDIDMIQFYKQMTNAIEEDNFIEYTTCFKVLINSGDIIEH